MNTGHRVVFVEDSGRGGGGVGEREKESLVEDSGRGGGGVGEREKES